MNIKTQLLLVWTDLPIFPKTELMIFLIIFDMDTISSPVLLNGW